MGLLVAANTLSPMSSAQERGETLSVDDHRPVEAAVRLLTTRYHRAITYEDPRYLYSGDTEVHVFPNGFRGSMPRGGRLSFRFRVAADTGQPVDWDALLRSLLAAQSASGGPRFRAEQRGDAYEVIPARTKNAAGKWVDVASIMDVLITIPEQELTRLGIVQAVIKAIGVRANVRLGVGTCLECGPRSMAPEPTEPFGVQGERARDVLWRALQHWRPGTFWRIDYDPDGDQYLMGVDRVPTPEVVPALPRSVLPSPPDAGGNPTCRMTPASTRPICDR